MTTPDPLNVKFAAMTRAERLEWMKRYPPVRPEDIPDSWVTVAGDNYSMHGHGLLRNILSGVAPLIAAAERERPTPEQMLREFHRAKAIHGGLMPSAPTAGIPERVRDLRMALLDEEVQELREAVAAGDIVKIADALGDIEYVTRGTAVAYGIPSDAVLAEVHRSNMTKDNTPEEAKLVKGPGYEPPRIAGLLGRNGGDG